MGVVQDQVLKMDELALDSERGDRVVEVRAFEPPLANRRARQPLVQADQNLGRCRFYFPISNREKSGVV